MAKALKVIGTVAVVAGLVIITGGAAIPGLAVALGSIAAAGGTILAAGLAIGTAGSLLSAKPKSPATSSSTVDRLQASVVLRTPRVFVAGSTALATDVRDQEWSADQSFLDRFILSASHRARGIREIWFDDKLAWTISGGVTATYAGYLWITPILEGSAANAIFTSARMGTSRRYTGCAYVHVRYKLTGNSKKTESPFAGGSIPSRITIIGDGIAVPDPRSGVATLGDQATWSVADAACRNPALVMLAYLLGWRINGKLAVGKGIPPARLDLASFATAANLCDEPVTRPDGSSEPRYRCDGIFSEGDETSLVLDNLKATMNAVLDDVDGRIRLTVLHNDLAAPIGELTAADVLGEYSWEQTVGLSDSVNIIRGGYTDPSTTSLYQMVDYPEVRIASPDGIDRAQTINLPLVQSAGQAQRLAKLRLARFQYGGTFTAVFQATAWKYQKGDVVAFSFYPLGWDKKLFRIADMTIQVDGTVPIMLREEHPDIYAAYSDEAAAVQGAAPTSYDPQLWPVIQGIADIESQVATILSDGVITHGREKRELVLQWQSLEAQFVALDARFVALGSPAAIATARGDAYAKYQALATLLAGLVPAWDAIGVDTPVDGAALNAAWASARQKLEVFAAAITGIEGPAGKNAPGISVDPAAFILRAAADGVPLPGQTLSINVTRANISGTTRFIIFNVDGNFLADHTAAEYAQGQPDYYASSGPDNLQLTATGLAVVMGDHGGAGGRFSLRAYVPGFAPTATVSVQRLVDGKDGTSAYSIISSNEAHQLPADAAGNVTSYGGATTTFTVLYGATDVTGSFDAAIAPGGNPQGLNVPGTYPTYSVVDGFDAGEDVASFTFRLTGKAGTAHAGVTLDSVFSLSKSRAGVNGSAPALITVEASTQQIKYSKLDQMVTGDVTIRTTRSNSGAIPLFELVSFDGFTHGFTGTAAALRDAYSTATFDTTGADVLILKAGWLNAIMQNFGGGLRVTAHLPGTAVTDTVSLTKIKDGTDGRQGDDAITLEPSAASVTFLATFQGVLKPNQLSQTVKFTFARGAVDVSSSTAWTLEASGCVAAISVSGLVSFSEVSASGYVRVTGVQAGVTRIKVVPLTVFKDPPPASEETRQSRTVSIQVNVTSFGSFPSSGIVSVKAGSTGTLQWAFGGSYDAADTGNVTLEGIFGFRAGGSNDAWTYLSAGAVTGTRARYLQRGGDEGEIIESGALTMSQAQGGMVAGALYDTGLWLRRSAGTVGALGSGTMTVTGS